MIFEFRHVTLLLLPFLCLSYRLCPYDGHLVETACRYEPVAYSHKFSVSHTFDLANSSDVVGGIVAVDTYALTLDRQVRVTSVSLTYTVGGERVTVPSDIKVVSLHAYGTIAAGICGAGTPCPGEKLFVAGGLLPTGDTVPLLVPYMRARQEGATSVTVAFTLTAERMMARLPLFLMDYMLRLVVTRDRARDLISVLLLTNGDGDYSKESIFAAWLIYILLSSLGVFIITIPFGLAFNITSRTRGSGMRRVPGKDPRFRTIGIVFFSGGFLIGAHRLYAGKWVSALWSVLTLGCCGIMWILDMFSLHYLAYTAPIPNSKPTPASPPPLPAPTILVETDSLAPPSSC